MVLAEEEEAAEFGETAAEGGRFGKQPVVVSAEDEAAVDGGDEVVGEDPVLGAESGALASKLLEVALLPHARAAGGLAVRDLAPPPALLGRGEGGRVRFFLTGFGGRGRCRPGGEVEAFVEGREGEGENLVQGQHEGPICKYLGTGGGEKGRKEERGRLIYMRGGGTCVGPTSCSSGNVSKDRACS